MYCKKKVTNITGVTVTLVMFYASLRFNETWLMITEKISWVQSIFRATQRIDDDVVDIESLGILLWQTLHGSFEILSVSGEGFSSNIGHLTNSARNFTRVGFLYDDIALLF